MADTEVNIQTTPTMEVNTIDQHSEVNVQGETAAVVVPVTVVQVASVGILGPRGPQGIQGPQGPQGIQGVTGPSGPGADTTYEHDQAVPASTWTITHNLGRRPSVTTVDSTGRVVYGDVSYPSSNQVVVEFSGGGFAGKAYLN